MRAPSNHRSPPCSWPGRCSGPGRVGLARNDSALVVAKQIGALLTRIGELVRQGRKNLTVIANDTARPGFGIGRLIDAKLVRTLVAELG